MSIFSRARAIFGKRQAPVPTGSAREHDEDRLRILVGRQKAMVRGRGSLNESEGLVRDAL
jgi:hypothetical protein